MIAELQHQEILLPSSQDSLVKLEAILEDLADKAQVSEELRGNIIVSVTEAMRNAIEFGNHNDARKNVKLSIDKNDGDLVVTVKDEGKGFDFENIADPTAPENLEKIAGRGIFLMRNLADKVEFADGGSKVQVHFKMG